MIRPRCIRLEAMTGCQLRCPSCPTAEGEIRRHLGTGYLRYSDFETLVDANPWVSHIELSNYGEIFLNPELTSIIHHAYKRNVNLSAANGVNLNTANSDKLEALVKYRFQSVHCSIDGATPEIYSIYRRGGDFETVIENIRRINDFKKKYRSNVPKLKWQFVIFRHNEHEISAARDMAGRLGMEFYTKPTWGDFYGDAFSPLCDQELVRRESGLEVTSTEECRNKYGIEYISNFCRQLWWLPQINYDGRILGCCINYWGDLGNAFIEGLFQGINNERMNYAREMVRGRTPPREDIPCSTCRFYEAMKADRSWVTIGNIPQHGRIARFKNMFENKILRL